MENNPTLACQLNKSQLKLGVILTYLPEYCKRFVVLLAVENPFDIADELELHLAVEDHIVPIASLHVLPKPVILRPITTILYPNLLIDLR